MIVPVLSVRDSLVGFGNTFTAVNTDVAVRGFTNSIIRSLECGSDDATSPEDLSLYLVGEFDTDNGVISPCEPCPLVRGHAIIVQHSNNTCCCTDHTGGDSVNAI